jgi:hypothetical protein
MFGWVFSLPRVGILKRSGALGLNEVENMAAANSGNGRRMLIAAALASALFGGRVESTVAQTSATAAKAGASAAPTAPTDYRSQHFLLHTDLSVAEAKDLLNRLEYMLGIISTYWAKPPQGILECYVVKDLKNWPDGAIPDEFGRAKIAEGAGVTVTLTLGNQAKSTVYAVADRGTPQHEAVHAYCGQNFGTTGPTWYSEGMAEMGQYWRKNDLSVQVHDVVIEHLRRSEPKSLNAIVNGNDRTGDSWQNYAWRWALCHLLATNPNYSANFRPLGLGLLHEKPVSFEQAYGHMAEEISFEYLFFLQHVCNGYRADLCAWDWKRKATALAAGTTRTVKIVANRGWQPTGVLAKTDVDYELAATGTWKTAKEATKGLTADGDEQGSGRLIGVLFDDYKLSEPFDLGASKKFRPPSDGHLFVRCQDVWSGLGDNIGAVDVKIAVPK